MDFDFEKTWEQMLDKMSKERKDNAENLTLGILNDKLHNFKDDCKIILSEGLFLDNSYDSYRGYYEDICFEFSRDNNKDDMSIGKLKKLIDRAFNKGIMYGYKGGEYDIDENTIVWISNYGSCTNMALTDVKQVNDDLVELVWKYKED